MREGQAVAGADDFPYRRTDGSKADSSGPCTTGLLKGSELVEDGSARWVRLCAPLSR
jgi:hypothetical protein